MPSLDCAEHSLDRQVAVSKHQYVLIGHASGHHWVGLRFQIKTTSPLLTQPGRGKTTLAALARTRDVTHFCRDLILMYYSSLTAGRAAFDSTYMRRPLCSFPSFQLRYTGRAVRGLVLLCDRGLATDTASLTRAGSAGGKGPRAQALLPCTALNISWYNSHSGATKQIQWFLDASMEGFFNI